MCPGGRIPVGSRSRIRLRLLAALALCTLAVAMAGCGDGPDPSPEAMAAELEAALTELVRGPSPEERTRGVTSFFSSETSHIVRSVSVEGGLARVDFRDFRPLIPCASSSAGSEAFLDDLNRTVFGAVPVTEVEYTLEGDCEPFWNFLQYGCQRVHRGNDEGRVRYSPHPDSGGEPEV